MISKLQVRLLSKEHLDGKVDQSSREFLGLIAEGQEDSRDHSDTNSHDSESAINELAALSKKDLIKLCLEQKNMLARVNGRESDLNS